MLSTLDAGDFWECRIEFDLPDKCAVRVLCGAGWATVIGVDAVPLAVHGNGRGEMVIGRLEDLGGASPAASAWGAYFRGRLGDITRLLAGVVTSSGPGASPPR